MKPRENKSQQCSNDIPQAAYRVVGVVERGLRSIGCVMGAKLKAGDMVFVNLFGRNFGAGSVFGRMDVGTTSEPMPHLTWLAGRRPISHQDPERKSFKFISYRNPFLNAYSFGMPHWAWLLFCVIAAGVPWVRWPKRFSLRTLLIATTLVAVVLGLAVWATRQ